FKLFQGPMKGDKRMDSPHRPGPFRQPSAMQGRGLSDPRVLSPAVALFRRHVMSSVAKEQTHPYKGQSNGPIFLAQVKDFPARIRSTSRAAEGKRERRCWFIAKELRPLLPSPLFCPRPGK